MIRQPETRPTAEQVGQLIRGGLPAAGKQESFGERHLIYAFGYD